MNKKLKLSKIKESSSMIARLSGAFASEEELFAESVELAKSLGFEIIDDLEPAPKKEEQTFNQWILDIREHIIKLMDEVNAEEKAVSKPIAQPEPVVEPDLIADWLENYNKERGTNITARIVWVSGRGWGRIVGVSGNRSGDLRNDLIVHFNKDVTEAIVSQWEMLFDHVPDFEYGDEIVFTHRTTGIEIPAVVDTVEDGVVTATVNNHHDGLSTRKYVYDLKNDIGEWAIGYILDPADEYDPDESKHILR